MVLFALIVFIPAVARAQEPAHSLQDLQAGLRIDDTVRMVGVDGNRIQGKVESISGSALKVRVNGVSREFREPQILEVRRRYSDSIGNGLGWGAVIGGVSGAVLGAVISDAFCDGCGNQQGTGAVVFGALGAAIGAGSGALGDSLKRSYATVYTMPRTTEKRFNLSPILTRDKKAVSVAFRF
jgi:hypothetical protein